MLALPGYGQQKPVARLPDTAMQQHYDAAYRLQDAGKPAQADAEHRLFLAAALHRIANGRANLGQYVRAKPVYEDALPFAPDEIALQIDYATAAVDAGDWANATMLAQRALHGLSAQSGQVRANATLLLAQALWGAGKQRESLEQFKAAAVLKPDFGTRYALARTYLALADKANAVRVFEQLVASQGDSAALHMQFGRAYALADLFPEAVEEFKTAIAKDSKFPGVHYSLGAAYMQLYAEQGYPQAEVEFRRELALYPNDTFTYPQLGVIAVSQHKLTEAEADFKRALQLNPALPGTYFALGKLYTSLGRNAEAEAALRKAIAETIDPSKDDYQGQRIHYALGRLLLEEGKRDEAKEQLKIAEDLLEQSRNEDASLMGRHAAAAAPLSKTHEAKPGERAIENEYERKVGPLIAASYNNLGVHAAIRGDYPAATGFFVKTAQWNPTLHGIDNNLGRAAFLAGDYRLASESLTRVVASQPQDVEARTMLGLSCYKMGAYGKTIEALKGMEGQLDARPPLALAYAESIFRARDAKDGLARLERLAAMHPDAAAPHQSLGEAYASNGDFERSARELRVALQLDPGNATIRRSLAASLTGLGQSAEAMALLKQLTQSGSTDAAAYLQLGRLQLANGDVGAGIATLQTSARLAPDDVDCHQALAEAYRRNAQPDEAKQEQQVAETLQDKRGSAAAAADAETTAEHASQTAGQTP
jgi:tetratricopeptide (TPR) repeat protein